MLWLTFGQAADAAEWSGEYRNIFFQTQNTRQQVVTTDLNRLRLNLEGESASWQWYIAYEQVVLWGGLLNDPWVAQGLRQQEATWMPARRIWLDRGNMYGQHRLYRGWVSYQQGNLDMKLGRQRIAWGAGRIWNPMDRFNPASPTALEPQQKLGVDALRMDWQSSGGEWTAVLAPGRASSVTMHKQALRWRTTWQTWDVAALWMQEQGQDVFGLDVTGNIGSTVVRLEGVQLPRQRHEWVLGVDGTWQSRYTPHGLYMALEYLRRDGVQPFGVSHVLAGGMLGYDVTALWRWDMLYLQDIQYHGRFVSSSLIWSAKEDVDMTLSAQWPSGKQGEFSMLQPLYALQWQYYF